MELEVTNRAPSATTIPNVNAYIDELFLYDISDFQDPDEDPLEYETHLIDQNHLPI